MAERRERLIAQAAAQRMALAQGVEPWRIPLARVDQGLAALHYIKSHPAWIVGSAVLLAALRISRVWKQLRSARATWQRMHKQRDR
ncbi:YqjK family protein [Sulfurimicrobium lacus]|uniref:YqjK family protein n=1 Tax=Sulfurimicrobium lacus TaxID=2715678 RepID=UPI001565CBF8|nr:YqjK family protein [Sulfurimicrobium lacus]